MQVMRSSTHFGGYRVNRALIPGMRIPDARRFPSPGMSMPPKRVATAPTSLRRKSPPSVVAAKICETQLALRTS
jgi:hypothetical protein